MRRWLAPLAIAALLGAAILFVGGDDVPVAGDEAADEQARYIIRGAKWRSHDEDGTVRVEGEADVIRYYDDDSARLDHFLVRMRGGDGRPWEARAVEGYSPPGDRHRLRLYGGVEGDGHWPDGEALIFNTEEVWVDSAEDTLETDARVTLRSAGRLGSASGLRISGKRNWVSLLDDVEIHYVVR